MRGRTSPRIILLCALALSAGVLACNMPSVSTTPAPTMDAFTPTPPTDAATPTIETIPPVDTAEPGPALIDGIHPLMLRNATYVLEGTSYTLEGGIFEDPSIPVRVGSADITALGDINGDNVTDAVTIVSQNTEGSGTFIYLAAMINTGVPTTDPSDSSILNNVASIGLGDRVIVRNIELNGGLINVDFTTQDADDPFCCPTLDVHQTLELQENTLVVLDEEVITGGFASYLLYDMTYTFEVNSYPLVSGFYQDTANNLTVTLHRLLDLNDLNGDGVNDAAVILVFDGGGTGKFVNLAAVVDQGGAPVHVATAYLGDREIIHSLWIDDFGTIHVEGTFHGDRDPGCCPATYQVMKYTLLDDQLLFVP